MAGNQHIGGLPSEATLGVGESEQGKGTLKPSKQLAVARSGPSKTNHRSASSGVTEIVDVPGNSKAANTEDSASSAGCNQAEDSPPLFRRQGKSLLLHKPVWPLLGSSQILATMLPWVATLFRKDW
ncbi:hypothetical protein NL676_024529 [Syzygium grande]|nr:hypothetical protein NL676_024529 [Syzygium grande]